MVIGTEMKLAGRNIRDVCGPVIEDVTLPIEGRQDFSWSSYWTNIIMPDGHTVGWYVAGDGSATYVTKDGSDFVSEWKDLSGANHPLLQATGTSQPLWEADGILFDGVDNHIRSGAFAVAPPFMYYIVMKQISYTINRYFLSGIRSPTDLRNIMGQTGASPSIGIYNGVLLASSDFDMDTFAIIVAKFKGATSTLKIGANAEVSGHTGNFIDGSGVTVGGISHSNIKVKELIIRTNDDDTTIQTAIYNYLANKYGFATI